VAHATAASSGGLSRSLVRLLAMEVILLALIIVLVFIAPGFATLGNLLNVLRTVSMLGIIAFGMTAAIIAGEIDLSVGAGAALAGCIVARITGLFDETLGEGPAILLGFVIAAAVGYSTGVVTGKIRQWFNVPTFITTLALFTALRGAANLVTGGFPLATFPDWFSFFGAGFLRASPFRSTSSPASSSSCTC
jgi:sugar transport system permease protein